MNTTILVAITILVAGCHTSTPVAEVPRGQDPDVPKPLQPVASTDSDARACNTLRAFHCPEGAPARGKCEDTFQHARTNESKGNAGAVTAVSACVAGASTVTVLRTCGGQSTLTFECR